MTASARGHAASVGSLGLVAADSLELQGPVDGHDEVDLGGAVAVEGRAVFVAELVGDGLGDGPAQDWQV